MPVRPDLGLGHQISEVLVLHLSSHEGRESEARDCYAAVRQALGREIPGSNVRTIRLALGIEQRYEQVVSYWRLPKHLAFEVTDADRELARALVNASANDAEFAALWNQNDRQCQVAKALAELVCRNVRCHCAF